MQYKFLFLPHIQSLRAFSVFFVILYHFNLSIFSKGYLGVDIFFVISGYVISQRLFKDYYEYKKIRVKDFFIRRFLRIFPNLFFVLGVTFIAYIIFAPPDLSIFLHTVTSIFAISNLYFLYGNKDYFDTVFTNPLGHTWSLGIEEQFYLIYPFVLILLIRFINNKDYQIFFFFITIMTLIILTIISYEKNPNVTFYFPIYRFWEFGIGCLSFLVSNRIKKYLYFSNFSLILIILVIFFIPKLNNIYDNIIITFLSAIYILFYQKNKFLETNILLYLGKISYSTYLWHLPIIFFINLYFNLIYTIIITFILSYIFSFFSHKYIEVYFSKRKLNKFYLNKFIILYASLFFILIATILNNQELRKKIRVTLTDINYLEKNFDWMERTVFSYNLNVGNKEVYKHCLINSVNFSINHMGLREECLKSVNKDILFFVEGNSHVAQFLTAMNETKNIENLYYKNIESDNFDIKKLNNLSKYYKKIVYVINWSNPNTSYIDKQLKNLRKNIDILIFNSTPQPTYERMALNCYIKKINCFFDKQIDRDNRNLELLNLNLLQLEKRNNRIRVFRSYEILCPKYKCVIYDNNKDLLIYSDGTHITKEGSRLLKKYLFKFIEKNYY